MLFCIFLRITNVKIISLIQKDFTSETPPPTEDRRVQFGINCPFKCGEAVSVWRLQRDGTTALLYTMFPTASDEHYLPWEGATVLE